MMKKSSYSILILWIVVIVLLVSCCTPRASIQTSYASFAQPTPDKKILYLLKGDTASDIVYDLWKHNPKWNGTNPSIIFIDSCKMIEIKSKLNYTSR